MIKETKPNCLLNGKNKDIKYTGKSENFTEKVQQRKLMLVNIKF